MIDVVLSERVRLAVVEDLVLVRNLNMQLFEGDFDE